MMQTPSLERRVVGLGVTVVVVVVAAVDILLYLTFRAQLMENLRELLKVRAEVVRTEAATHSGRELAARLSQLGLRATVRTPDGAVYQSHPPSPVLGPNFASRAAKSESLWVSREVPLANGATATVFAPRTGVDDALRKLLVLEAVGLVVATLLAALLLLRTSGRALQPLRQIAASARRTSAGQRGERLSPDRPNTSLGQLATAYDDMVDKLEQAVRSANEAHLESDLLYLQLRQTIETANAAFIAIDASGAITEWNNRAEEIFGWLRKEAVGRDLAQLIIPPAHRAAHYAGLTRFLETGEHSVLGKTVEFEAVRRDGETFPVELSPWVTHVGDTVTFNGFVRDVTERRRGEEAIGRLAAVVASAQEAILSTTLDGTIVTWNSGAERVYQYPPLEAIGRSVSLIVPPEDSDCDRQMRERAMRGEAVGRYETVRRRKDGSLVDVAVTLSPIFDREGSVTGIAAVARDITDQRRIASVLDATLTALETALEEARYSEERSRRFLADAAHQLRSPLSGIRACAETLLRGWSETQGEELLADLVRETARAGRILTSLLRLARLDQGAMDLAVEECDVVALCQSEIDRARLRAPEIAIALNIGPIRHEKPKLDPRVVVEVLSNLLDNACRHATSRIDVRLCGDAAAMRIVVSDDGPGVPQAVAEQIFERFVSLDGKGGSGLGLPIARALAQAHGGDVTYEGRAFVLMLPWQPSPAEDFVFRK
ncbi:MAG: PAS domain S-box protein [Actinomycetota bacterium]|nr:PAS domain S-box protein [Actinomycetota bacterium]